MLVLRFQFDRQELVICISNNGGHSLLDGATESEVLSSATTCARNIAIRKRSEPVEVTDLYFIYIELW